MGIDGQGVWLQAAVEVPVYSSKTGTHAEAGGEINRDEVPIEYHEYVQQYFEQIRKTPPTPNAKK